MMTPRDVGALRFRSRETMFGEWYLADDVDSALESIEYTIRSLWPMSDRYVDSMTAADVHCVGFTTVRSGGNDWYKAGQVDDFLDDCADSINALSVSAYSEFCRNGIPDWVSSGSTVVGASTW